MTENKLSEEKISECLKVFNEIDKDKNGDIDVNELGYALNSIGSFLSEYDLNKLIKEFDCNKSGRIDFEEFLTIVALNMPDSHNEEDILECFTIMDKNDNGTVSCKDLILLITSMGERLSKEEAEEIIREIDPDNNGYIKYNEYMKIRKSL